MFLLSNFIFTIIEYGLLFLLNYKAFNMGLTAAIIVTAVVFSICLLLTIVASFQLKTITDLDDYQPGKERLLKLIESANKKYGLSFELVYVTSIQPSPAWVIKDKIFINNKYLPDEMFLEGIVGHEIGHVISGLSKYTVIASLRISTIINRVLFAIIQLLINKAPEFLIYIIYGIYIFFSIPNIIGVYPFVVKDEFIANSYCIKLGYGDSLRAYYSFGLNKENNEKWIRLTDFTHPSIEKMIDKMNEEMRLNNKTKNMYILNDTLIASYQTTPTSTLPQEVKNIYFYAYKDLKNLKKIKGEGVEHISGNAFSGCDNIEELIFPNLKDFSYSSFNNLKKIKKVEVNDEAVKEKIMNIINKGETK